MLAFTFFHFISIHFREKLDFERRCPCRIVGALGIMYGGKIGKYDVGVQLLCVIVEY